MPAGKPESARGVGSLGSGRPSGGRGSSTASSGGNVRVIRPKNPMTNPKSKMPTGSLTKPIKVSKAKEAKLLKGLSKPTKSTGARIDAKIKKSGSKVSRETRNRMISNSYEMSGKVKAMNKKGM
jgi:hypothetical protein